MTLLRADTKTSELHAYGKIFACTFGQQGNVHSQEKREGDGKSPLGIYLIRAALIRADRIDVRPHALPWRTLHISDGWSDDVRDPAYNRPVTHPHKFPAEKLWRADSAYDIILVLGHNDSPPVAGMGSAIFFHCRNDKNHTEGCIAIDRAEMMWLLPQLQNGDQLEII